MKKLLSALILLAFNASAYAALVSGNVTGVVDSADSGNIYGLGVGDTISLDVVFDDSGLTGVGAESVFFNAMTGNTMLFTVGSFIFTEAMDTAGGLGPNLFFLDGNLTEIQYDTVGAFGVFFSFIEFFQAGDIMDNTVNGTWDLGSYTVSPAVVPVPAAIWLLGSSLLLLLGISRHKK